MKDIQMYKDVLDDCLRQLSLSVVCLELDCFYDEVFGRKAMNLLNFAHQTRRMSDYERLWMFSFDGKEEETGQHLLDGSKENHFFLDTENV